MARGEVRTIALDFTPDFVCMVSEPTSTNNKIYTYCGITCIGYSEELTAVTYAPNMSWFVVNGDTYDNKYGSCVYITIAENEIQLTDSGYGSKNVFWIAVKCKD